VEQAASVETVAVPKVESVAPVPAQASPKVEAPKLAPRQAPPEDDRVTFTDRDRTYVVSLRADDDDAAMGFVVVTLDGPDSSEVEPATSPVNLDGCLLDQMELSLDVIAANEESRVVEIQASCVIGATVRRFTINHIVLWVGETGDLAVVFRGESFAVDNRRLAVVSERLEFHLEANDLAVYRQTVAWCDKAGLRELVGRASCRVAPRRLKLVKRISL